MEINGSNALNANNYRKISMHKNINVLAPNKNSKFQTNHSFTKSLRGKTDEEKREEVIRYFLRNHKISMVYEDNKDILIESVSGVQLIISKINSLSNQIIKEIIEKYSVDRMEEYATADVEFYWFVNRSSDYCNERGYFTGIVESFQRDLNGLPRNMDGKMCLVMDIATNGKSDEPRKRNISPSENDFLKRMLEDMHNIKFDSYSNDLFRENIIFSCEINDKKVKLVVPRCLWSFANAIDEKQKKEDNCKKLQFKMEGF